jgi:Domain of unknown function (DUF4252)
MKKTMQWMLAMAIAAAPMANAQLIVTKSLVTAPDFSMQAENVSMAAAGAAQVKDDLFAGTEKFAQGASDVTEINLDPKMMGMVGDKKGGSDLARKMNFMVIHTYTYDKPGMYRMEDVEAYRKKLEDGTWSCSVHVRDKSGTTDICSRTAADHESCEMVILTAEPKELTFIHMSGNMSLDDLGKMGGAKGALKNRTP